MRAFSAAALGEPVSQTSVGSLIFSWAMEAAPATVGATKAPATASPAADKKAFRDVGSAFKAVVFWTLAAGAKADETARVERMARTESFIVDYKICDVWFIRESRYAQAVLAMELSSKVRKSDQSTNFAPANDLQRLYHP